jgi:hypothetical protein
MAEGRYRYRRLVNANCVKFIGRAWLKVFSLRHYWEMSGKGSEPAASSN